MSKPFKNLIEALPKGRRDRIDIKKEEIISEICLSELRQAFKLTQNQLAETLKVNQAAISKMESQSDMYISTLRRFLKAMGGTLKIVAEFPDGHVVINQFEQECDNPKTN